MRVKAEAGDNTPPDEPAAGSTSTQGISRQLQTAQRLQQVAPGTVWACDESILALMRNHTTSERGRKHVIK
ncbi:hypothetical protein HK097_004934 [Rhizophlyctis rosea]|uniref:Uncharacterized protein n=1 Tax=Rhizophlyctis rosea TaxID=64517 RepID=A0AAD5S240_9FUNG|nr:hypothetical protein HK097_004934 [Rhizophlyctis rosea]